MIRINNWPNQRRGTEKLSSGSSVNPWSARYGGEITVFTYVCGTMEVHKQGTLEVHFTSWRYITYVRGTPAVQSAPPECPVVVQFLPCFYFLWINFKKSYCCNGGTENCETTCRLLVYAWSMCLCAYLALISCDTVPLRSTIVTTGTLDLLYSAYMFA
jgi:hypothetical protein